MTFYFEYPNSWNPAGPFKSEYEHTTRPDPTQFRPQDEPLIARANDDLSQYRSSDPYSVPPRTSIGWVRHKLIPYGRREGGLFWRWFGAVTDKLAGVLTAEEEFANASLHRARARRGALWGAVVGWCVAEDPARLPSSLQTLLEAARYAVEPEVAFVEVARRLCGSESDALAGPTLLRPKLPPRAVPRSVLFGARYLQEHLLQTLNQVPPEARDAASETFAAAAPAVDGLLACRLFQRLTIDGLNGRSVKADWGWSAGELWGLFDTAEPGGRQLSARVRAVTVARDTPLVAPSTATDVLHAAVWANLGGTRYAEVLEAVMSLGGDTVATAAAAGAIAACQFGVEGIPDDLRARVPDAAVVDALAKAAIERDG